MSAVEIEISDDKVVEFLDEIYPDDVIVCGMPMTQSRILKELDEPAFNEFRNNNMSNSWKCSECDAVYEEEDDAEECWKTCQDTAECDLCGEPFIRKDDTGRFCSDKCRQADENNLNSHLADPEEIDWDKDDPDWSIRLDSSGL